MKVIPLFLQKKKKKKQWISYYVNALLFLMSDIIF